MVPSKRDHWYSSASNTITFLKIRTIKQLKRGLIIALQTNSTAYQEKKSINTTTTNISAVCSIFVNIKCAILQREIHSEYLQ